jgi:HEAT repeat protein
MLSADQNLGDRGQHLASNREMAQALADVLSEELRHGGQAEIDREYAAFLARALGLFNIPEIVVPPLEEAMQPGHDREVRKNAIASIAVMTDRLASANQTWDASHAAESLRLTSMDPDPVFRQLCAFALGQFNDAASQARLEVMLEDGDADTRVNAAIGLARQGDPRGAVVIGRVLQQAGDRSPVEGDDWERFLSLKNCLTAVERLAPTWTKSQRDELSAQLAPIAADHQEPKIRILAKSALAALAAQ